MPFRWRNKVSEPIRVRISSEPVGSPAEFEASELPSSPAVQSSDSKAVAPSKQSVHCQIALEIALVVEGMRQRNTLYTQEEQKYIQ